MSHEKEVRIFPATKTQAAIQSELSLYVSYKCFEEGGHLGKIQWLEDTIYDSESDAREAIERLDNGDYDCLAVKFRQGSKDGAKYRELQAKEGAAWKAFNDLCSQVPAKNFKAQFVGCRKCGSKLNKDYIRLNRCPVCGGEMRSDTELKKIARLKAKAEAASAAREAEERAQGRKSKNVFWAVKIEYHT